MPYAKTFNNNSASVNITSVLLIKLLATYVANNSLYQQNSHQPLLLLILLQLYHDISLMQNREMSFHTVKLTYTYVVISKTQTSDLHLYVIVAIYY